MKTLNKAIVLGHDFYIYRTVDGKVEKYKIALMGIKLETGQLDIQYHTDEHETLDSWKQEIATPQDLTMIREQARVYQQRMLAKRAQAS